MPSLLIDAENLSAAIRSKSPARVLLAPQVQSKLAASRLPIPPEAQRSFLVKPAILAAYVLPNMRLDYRSVVTLDGAPFDQPDLLPLVEGDLMRVLDNNRKLAHVSDRFVDGPVYVLTTPRFRQYGHFLTEVFPRLLLIRQLMSEGHVYPVLMPIDAPAFMVDFCRLVLGQFEAINIDDNRESIRLGTGIVAGLGSFNYYFHPALDPLINAFVRRTLGAPTKKRQKLFVGSQEFRNSDRKNDVGVMENEAELTAIAKKKGYTVVEPLTMPLVDQIKLFASASSVVGEASSALNNAIFAPADCSVISLNYRSSCQTTIAALRGQEISYILPDDGQVRNFERQGAFRIDPKAFKAAL